MSSAICPLCHHDPERALEHWGCDCDCHCEHVPLLDLADSGCEDCHGECPTPCDCECHVDHDPPRVAEDEERTVAAGEGAIL